MSIAFVQDAISGVPAAGVYTITLGVAPTVGNTLFALLAANTAGAAITSIAQTNVSWAAVAQSATNLDTEIWRGTTTGGTPGTTVTVTCSGSPIGGRCNVSEFSGIAASPNDASAPNSGTGTVVSTASITPTASKNVLLLAITNHNSGNAFTSGPSGTGSGASWAALPHVFAGDHFNYAIVVSTSGTYSVSDTWTGSNVWDALIADFLATVAPAGKLFRPAELDGMGGGGPFFRNPIN